MKPHRGFLRAVKRSGVQFEDPSGPAPWSEQAVPSWLEDHARQRAWLELRTACVSYRAREISLALGALLVVVDLFIVVMSSSDHRVLATGGLMGAGIALISVAAKR